LNPGDVAITAFVRNGNSQFAFVNTTANTFPSGTVIYFTNYSYDASVQQLISTNQTVTAGAVTEGTVAYTVGAGGLAPYTPVIIGKITGASDLLQGGSVVLANGGTGTSPWLIFNGNGSGDKIIAYTASSAIAAGGSVSGATFVNAVLFGPDTWFSNSSSPVNCYDSALPSGLTSGTNALDLSAIWNSNIAIYGPTPVKGGNQNTVLSSCQNSLAGIETVSNWTANVAPKTAFSLSLGYATASINLTPGGTPTGTATPVLGNSSCTVGNAGVNITTATLVIPSVTSTFTNTFTVTSTVSSTMTNTPAANSSTATSSATTTATNTVSNTMTNTATNSSTNTATTTPTNSITNTPGGNTSTPSNTPTITSTYTSSNTATNTFTATITFTPTNSFTATSSFTLTSTTTATGTSTSTGTPSNTATATNTATVTSTYTPTSTGTSTPTYTATSTGTLFTATFTGTATSTFTQTITPTITFTSTSTLTATFTPLATAIAVINNPTAVTTVVLSNGTGVQIPPGTFSGPTTITVASTSAASAPPISGFQFMGNVYNFSATTAGGAVSTFATPVTLIFGYDPTQLPSGYDPRQLVVKYYNTAQSSWQSLTTLQVDTVNHTISVLSNHFSTWGVFTQSFLSTASSGGGNILAPVPANNGDSICLYTGQALNSSTWTVYSVAGYRVASLNFTNQPTQCWTAQVGRGLYYVKLILNFVDGTSTTEWHKVIVK
jgi:hypothetical protein